MNKKFTFSPEELLLIEKDLTDASRFLDALDQMDPYISNSLPIADSTREALTLAAIISYCRPFTLCNPAPPTAGAGRAVPKPKRKPWIP